MEEKSELLKNVPHVVRRPKPSATTCPEYGPSCWWWTSRGPASLHGDSEKEECPLWV